MALMDLKEPGAQKKFERFRNSSGNKFVFFPNVSFK